jgi:arylsulfatase A-like enzyme
MEMNKTRVMHGFAFVSVLLGDHKLIHFLDDDSVELYDLKRDISETTNLADAKPELAATMRQRLATWLKDSGAKLPRPRRAAPPVQSAHPAPNPLPDP